MIVSISMVVDKGCSRCHGCAAAEADANAEDHADANDNPDADDHADADDRAGADDLDRIWLEFGSGADLEVEASKLLHIRQLSQIA